MTMEISRKKDINTIYPLRVRRGDMFSCGLLGSSDLLCSIRIVQVPEVTDHAFQTITHHNISASAPDFANLLIIFLM